MGKSKRILQFLWQAVKGVEADLTKMPIRNALVYLAIPMIMEMIMESLFAVVDIFFVSRLGKEAVSTVGLTENMMFIVYSIGVGVSMAATAMVARRIGEKETDEAARTGVQAFYVVGILGVIIGLIGIFYASDLLSLMGASGKIVEEYAVYAQLMIGSSLIIFFLFLFNGIFRGAGDAHLALRVLFIANVLNMILDPCLIFGLGPFPELGLKGAVMATIIGRGIAVLIQIYLFARGTGRIKIRRAHFQFQWKIVRRLIMLSQGSVMQFLIETASWLFLIRLITRYGDGVIAAYTIAFRILIFTILPSWGLANAAATLVGQNLGAQQPDRASRAAWLAATYNVVFLTAVSIVFYLAAPWIMSKFIADAAVIAEGTKALKIICAGYVAFALGMVLGQAFNGAGDTKTPMIVNIVCFWVVQIPLAYLMAVTLDLGSRGVYWSIAISHSLLAVIFVVLFRKGQWKYKIV